VGTFESDLAFSPATLGERIRAAQIFGQRRPERQGVDTTSDFAEHERIEPFRYLNTPARRAKGRAESPTSVG